MEHPFHYCIWKWVSNEVPLYSLRNYIQYPLIHNGKEYEKEYIYVQLNHLAVYQKLTQYHVNKTSIKFEKRKPFLSIHSTNIEQAFVTCRVLRTQWEGHRISSQLGWQTSVQ